MLNDNAIHKSDELRLAKTAISNIYSNEVNAAYIDQLAKDLSYTLTLTGPNFLFRIKVLSDLINDITNQDVDPVIGYICTRGKEFNDFLYPMYHMVFVSIMVAILTRELGWNIEKRKSTISAALTMNISMYILQAALSKTKTISAWQKTNICYHPHQSYKILLKKGVTDYFWLDAVEQHHEQWDGTGYPGKISGTKIHEGARIIQLMDTFCAKTNSRKYRKMDTPVNALRSILHKDDILANKVIKLLGIFPCGTIVKLANGEMGVVVKRTQNPKYPLVKSISINNSVVKMQQLKDVANSEHAIVKILTIADLKSDFDSNAFWFKK